MHHGPPGGEGIGSRARRGSHNQAVSTVAANKIGVNEELKLNHAGERAFINYHFIEHALIVNYFACALEFGTDHNAFAERVAAFQRVIAARVQFFHSEAGKESQATHSAWNTWISP